jgi:ribosome maturation factor RimP
LGYICPAKENNGRERNRSLLLFHIVMNNETTIATVTAFLSDLLEDDVFLVDMKVKPTNNIKIYIDADAGLPLDKCIKINRALYKKMEEAALFPDGDFSLEVSSPGIDEPLKLHRQYLKNKGRNVEVLKIDGTKKEGMLSAVNDEAITLEFTEGKGKKAVQHQLDIPFSEIKQTKVQIKF